MRKCYNITSLLIVLLLIQGCETEPILFEGPYHVRFTNATETQRESFSKTIKVEVHLAAPARDQDVIVQYTIRGSARENIDYKIIGTRGSIIIPRGKYFGYIEMQLINNSNNILRSQDVEFRIDSVSDTNLAIGQGAGGIGKSITYTILDDCVLGGYYTGSRGAFTIPIRDITITSIDCESYILSNWNINIYREPLDIPLQFIDNFDNTLTIPQQERGGDEIFGTGIVSPVTGQITLTITIVLEEGNLDFTINLFRD
jgi:hypothetical protein